MAHWDVFFAPGRVRFLCQLPAGLYSGSCGWAAEEGVWITKGDGGCRYAIEWGLLKTNLITRSVLSSSSRRRRRK